MLTHVGRLVILVMDYDEALQFYTEKFEFEKIVDVTSGDKRFLHVKLLGQGDFGIWFMKAETSEQQKHVGNQTGGPPCFAIYSNDFEKDYEDLRSRGVEFVTKPKEDSGAVFAHMKDLYGNEIVLVQLLQPSKN